MGYLTVHILLCMYTQCSLPACTVPYIILCTHFKSKLYSKVGTVYRPSKRHKQTQLTVYVATNSGIPERDT